MILAAIKGFALGGSLIVAIGAQNAFVLSQALRRDHAVSIALVCSAIDAGLIALGVWGLGAFIETSPRLLLAITLAGAAFLLVYGLLAFRRARHPAQLRTAEQPRMASRRAAVATAVALSLLNPHVYLDTVLLLGSVGGRLPGQEPLAFAIGAMCASFVWFMMLAIGGRALAPVLDTPTAWQKLDIVIGVIMWLLGFSLLRSAFALMAG